MAGRRTRWTVLVVLLAGVPWAIYWLLERTTEADLLPALSLALVVMTLALFGVLIRNLVRLIIERKRGVLGSTLRIKLVFFYVALVLLPAIVLFYGSAHVIKQTVEAILSAPLEQLVRGQEIVDEWNDYFRNQCLGHALALADEIERLDHLAPDRREELARFLERRQRMDGLQIVRVAVEGRGTVASAEGGVDPSTRRPLIGLVEEQVRRTLAEGRARAEFEKVDGGLSAIASAPVRHEGDQPSPRARAVVAVAIGVPERIAESVTGIHGGVQSYRQFRTQRRDLVRFYVTLIGLIFIATLFVATWIGMFVARRITEPIQEMATASREISAGNLGVRVEAQAGGEMGNLIDAFNEMAAELQENREVITRSTAQLRRSNQALDERRRYIETLVANLSTAVISLDPVGRVTTANPAVERILGVTLRAGDNARMAFASHGLAPLGEVLAHFAGAERRGVRRDVELPESAPTRSVSIQVSPLLGPGGEDLGLLLMVEDLTDLLRAQKMAAWHDVARRIAHEIKNPLTPIQLAAQRLRKRFLSGAEDLDQVLVESTDSIEREVTGLKQLVNEFSKFARMPEVSPRPVEFQELVDSVLALYKGLPGVEWEVAIDAAVGSVEVDPQQMRRVLINLIDNAVGAIDSEGRVRISARRQSETGTLVIEVADSGGGIAPGDRDKMFMPYFSTKSKGTGLGLAIVHKIVTDHRGTIRVEDNQPRGARFVIEVPA